MIMMMMMSAIEVSCYLGAATLGAAVPAENRARNTPLVKSSIDVFFSQ